MQLSINRYFKHKYYPGNIIKSTMRAGHSNTLEKEGLHHLYIDLISGDSIKGMDGNQSFMLSTSYHQDNWTEQLEAWAKQNQYLDHNPFRMSLGSAAALLAVCHKSKAQGQRLGQAIINQLGEKTPVPNNIILSCTDETKVLEWFYNHCVVQTSIEV